MYQVPVGGGGQGVFGRAEHGGGLGVHRPPGSVLGSDAAADDEDGNYQVDDVTD